MTALNACLSVPQMAPQYTQAVTWDDTGFRGLNKNASKHWRKKFSLAFSNYWEGTASLRVSGPSLRVTGLSLRVTGLSLSLWVLCLFPRVPNLLQFKNICKFKCFLLRVTAELCFRESHGVSCLWFCSSILKLDSKPAFQIENLS